MLRFEPNDRRNQKDGQGGNADQEM